MTRLMVVRYVNARKIEGTLPPIRVENRQTVRIVAEVRRRASESCSVTENIGAAGDIALPTAPEV